MLHFTDSSLHQAKIRSLCVFERMGGFALMLANSHTVFLPYETLEKIPITHRLPAVKMELPQHVKAFAHKPGNLRSIPRMQWGSSIDQSAPHWVPVTPSLAIRQADSKQLTNEMYFINFKLIILNEENWTLRMSSVRSHQLLVSVVMTKKLLTCQLLVAAETFWLPFCTSSWPPLRSLLGDLQWLLSQRSHH